MRNGLKEDKVPGAVAWTWTGEGELERMALLLISMSKVLRVSFSLLHFQKFFFDILLQGYAILIPVQAQTPSSYGII